MDSSGIYISFIFLLLARLGGCQQIGEPWTSVVNSDIYKKQNPCVKSCLLDVVNHVPPCTDYGCICVGDALGTNFVTAWTEVSSCAQTCGTASDAVTVANALRDICLVAVGTNSSTTSSSSSPSTPSTSTLGNSTAIATVIVSTTGTPSISTGASSANPSSSTLKPAQTPSLFLINDTTFYPNLGPCSKMAINACRNTAGDIEELPCSPTQNDGDWDTYLGLAYQLQATNASQICDGVAFYISCSTLANRSLHFCNYLPTLKDRPDPEYDSMQGFLADWCVDNNFPPASCVHIASGDRNSSDVKKSGVYSWNFAFVFHADGREVLSTGDKIAIGLGLPATLSGILAVVFGGISALAALRTLRSS